MSFYDSLKKMFSSRTTEDRTALSRKVQASPQDPQARQKLGAYLLRQGEIVEGLDQLARAAVMYEKDGFAGKAVAVLRQMVKNDPSNLDFLRWLIRLLGQEGLTGDAHGELENIAGRQDLFVSSEQRTEFFRQVGESLPQSPLPSFYIVDSLRVQKRLLEATGELGKIGTKALYSGMVAEFAERVESIVAAAGDDVDILEPCGFLWLRVRKTEEGISLLSRIVEMTRNGGDVHRAEEMEKVLAAIKEGWDAAAAEAVSFIDAAEKMSAPPPSPVSPPGSDVPPATGEEESSRQTAGYREEESMVKDALTRLQAKVHAEIGESDPDARYNLGIAYKEMGLLEEAAREFSLARRKPELYVGASSLLADTLAAKDDFGAAVATLDEVLAAGTLTDAEVRDVRYQKAEVLSRAGNEEEAKGIFLSLYEEAPEYRDVAARMERYRQ